MSLSTFATRHSRRALLLGMGAALCITVAACGSSGSSSAKTSDTTSATSSASAGSAFAADQAKYSAAVTSYPSVPAIPGVSSLKGKTIWYVPIGDSVPILNAFGVGMQQALDQAGIKYHLCDGKFLPTNAASCLQQAASQGASAVVTGYIDYALIPTAFDNLVAHHIPVLVAGEAPDGGKTSSPQLAFYDTTSTFSLLQKLQMQRVIQDSGGKAKILYLGVIDSPATKAGAAAGKAFIQQNCSGCSLTEIDYNTASINKVPSQVSAALISHPDTNYVVDELDAAGQGTVAGIQNAGFTNKVKVSGTNGDLDAMQRLATGTLQFLDIGFSPIYTGWQYADGILRMLAGQVPNEGVGVVRIFDKSNIGSLTLTPEAYATNAWYGSDAFKQTFSSAWGLS